MASSMGCISWLTVLNPMQSYGWFGPIFWLNKKEHYYYSKKKTMLTADILTLS
jgi:hypothetical protein